MLRPITPFPITAAPGFQGFADEVLRGPDAEDVVWSGPDGDIGLRAIVRQSSAKFDTPAGVRLKVGTTTALVDALKVQGILPEQRILVRGIEMQVAPGGVHPDGRAFVKLELRVMP